MIRRALLSVSAAFAMAATFYACGSGSNAGPNPPPSTTLPPITTPTPTPTPDWRAAFCDTRQEGNPQRVACDALVVGRAADTGRYGPTWEKDGKACVEAGTPTEEGCTNHASNQFLAIARGSGQMLACASSEWPATGSRCAGCTVDVTTPICK